ncbi:MAG: hypothetical protein U5L96_13480 [Owenweeksia sp.]|nr:hypothetical protein [Owenweeksia sp.]
MDPIDSSHIYTHFMTPDRGQTWQYPYSVVHPTESYADFGARANLEILPDGSIITLNNGSNGGSGFKGINRWDGQQWHSYGQGLYGGSSRAFDFEFYKGELYMGGTFNQYDYPQDPGNFIVRWDGNQWQGLANGTFGFVDDLFVHDSLLYCKIYGDYSYNHRFGDAAIPYFAAWNGQQWCGTPMNFKWHPFNFGFANDTLFVAFNRPTRIDGDTVGYLNYYTGDYVNGPNAICSTPGLGEEEMPVKAKGLEVFPNPAFSILHIRLLEEDQAIRQIDVVNCTGQNVMHLKLEKGIKIEQVWI